ncbi:MAG: hypothetical protein IKV21_06210 [Clostridia bacterium]|nr:hypothetical protein [Clostridia bacterium]
MNKEKNKKNKKKTGLYVVLVNISVFVLLLVLPTTSWVVLSVANIFSPSVMETLDYDTGENRNKKEFELSDGLNNIFYDFEQWYNDRVPFRSVILTAQKDFWGKVEEPYNNKIRPALLKLLYSGDKQEEADTEFIDSIPGIPDASEHKYKLISSVEADCKTQGEQVYKCKKCDKEEKIVIPPAHTPEVIKVVEASLADYGYTLNKCTVCETEYRTEITNRLPDDTFLPLVVRGQAIEGKHNWLFYNGENSMAYYKGTNILSEEQMQEYERLMKKLKSICDEKGIRLQYMIMPNKEQVYSEFMPDVEVKEGKKRVELFVEHMEKAGINIVFPLEALRQAKPYWLVYKRHDTHWSAAGAYIGVQELYKALGMETTDLMTLKVKERSVKNGGLIQLGGYSENAFTGDKNYTITYKPEIELTYESGEKKGAVTRISESTSENKCNFVLLGDSFRTEMIRFLEKDFSRCTITHKNNMGQTAVINAVREADILVISSVERYDASLIEMVRTVIGILS